MTTDLSKLTKEEKEALCRKYFVLGCFLVPFLWLINFIWFFKEAFCGLQPNKKIRRYILQSLLGCVVWIACWTAWIVIYQRDRASWGIIGDMISATAPNGIA
jgi:presenilin enhancer 2